MCSELLCTKEIFLVYSSYAQDVWKRADFSPLWKFEWTKKKDVGCFASCLLASLYECNISNVWDSSVHTMTWWDAASTMIQRDDDFRLLFIRISCWWLLLLLDCVRTHNIFIAVSSHFAYYFGPRESPQQTNRRSQLTANITSHADTRTRSRAMPNKFIKYIFICVCELT